MSGSPATITPWQQVSPQALPERALVLSPAAPPPDLLQTLLGEPLTEAVPYALLEEPKGALEADPATRLPRQPALPGTYRVVVVTDADTPGIISDFHHAGQVVTVGITHEELTAEAGQRELTTLLERLLYRHRLQALWNLHPQGAGPAKAVAGTLRVELREILR